MGEVAGEGSEGWEGDTAAGGVAWGRAGDAPIAGLPRYDESNERLRVGDAGGSANATTTCAPSPTTRDESGDARKGDSSALLLTGTSASSEMRMGGGTPAAGARALEPSGNSNESSNDTSSCVVSAGALPLLPPSECTLPWDGDARGGLAAAGGSLPGGAGGAGSGSGLGAAAVAGLPLGAATRGALLFSGDSTPMLCELSLDRPSARPLELSKKASEAGAGSRLSPRRGTASGGAHGGPPPHRHTQHSVVETLGVGRRGGGAGGWWWRAGGGGGVVTPAQTSPGGAQRGRRSPAPQPQRRCAKWAASFGGGGRSGGGETPR